MAYKEKKCRVCGQLFVPVSARQADCNRIIVKTCVICGKQFEGRCSKNDVSQTCSKECQDKFALLQRQKSYSKTKKICELCGKPFRPVSNTQKICSDIHYRKCKICGKQFVLNTRGNKSDWPVTCSKECATKLKFVNGNPFSTSEGRAKIKATLMQKYGVEHPAQAAEVRAKMQATTKERYGTKFFAQSEQYIKQTTQTNREKYGTDWPIQNKDVLEKARNTTFEHYGVHNPMESPELVQKISDTYFEHTGYRYPLQNPEFQEKMKEINLGRYGVEHYSQTDEFKEKFKQTSLERYGTEWPTQSNTVKDKTKQTNLERYGADNYLRTEEGKEKVRIRMQERYGVDNYLQLPESRQSRMKDPTKIDEWLKFLNNIEDYLTSFEDKPTYHQLSTILGVSESTIGYYVNLHNLQHLVKYSLSDAEQDIAEWIRSLSSYDVIQHDRATIAPNELDISIPELKFAIEYDPTVTHNSSFCDPWGTNPKLPSYHKLKTDRCEEKGIFLFHIFGYEWTYKQDIIQSMIKNILGANDFKLYARKCYVKEVNGKDAFEFLENNHRQGGVNSAIRLGLYYNDELVSLMTFGKMRETIGTGNEDLSECYELVRFCCKLNTTVVGGASKLFAHFIKLYNPKQIRSFSDRAHTKGTLYLNLGFHEIRRSTANYVWVDTHTDKAYHRSNTRKSNLINFLQDDSIDLAKSEKQIMEEHSYAQVFDSGTITWEWRA